MTYEEKVAWLRRYQDSLRREKVLELEIEQLQTQAERVTQALTGMPIAHANSNGVIPGSVERILEKKECLLEELHRGISAREEIELTIGLLDDARMRDLFSLRYIQGRSWEDIANTLHYSIQHIYRLHREAVFLIEIKETI